MKWMALLSHSSRVLNLNLLPGWCCGSPLCLPVSHLSKHATRWVGYIWCKWVCEYICMVSCDRFIKHTSLVCVQIPQIITFVSVCKLLVMQTSHQEGVLCVAIMLPLSCLLCFSFKYKKGRSVQILNRLLVLMICQLSWAEVFVSIQERFMPLLHFARDLSEYQYMNNVYPNLTVQVHSITLGAMPHLFSVQSNFWHETDSFSMLAKKINICNNNKWWAAPWCSG